MEKNTFIAVGLSLLILVLWPFIFNNKKIDQAKQTVVAESVSDAKKDMAKDITFARTGINNTTLKPMQNAKMYYIENELVKIAISSNGAKVVQVTFKKYNDEKKNPIIFFSKSSEQLGAFSVDEIDSVIFEQVQKGSDNEAITLEGKGVKVEYSLKKGNYFADVKITDPKAQKLNFRLLSSFKEGTKDDYGLSSDPEKRKKDYLIYAGEKVERVSNKDLAKKKAVMFSTLPKWVALSDRYFLLSIIGSNVGQISEVGLSYQEQIPAYFMNYSMNSKDGLFSYRMFVGPKDVDYLRKADTTLSESIDYGWLAVISVPILELMKFFYRIIPNYGVAILLLTLFVRILMYPLQHKSMKSMKKMQELQPMIKQLQEKYKDNKEKLNTEMVQFMRTNKVNPMSGCLPMLIQLPVFIALYKVLANAVELYRSPFIFWIHDLSIKDPYYVFPVIMGAMMFIQQKITPNPTMDQTQAKMMLYMLPILFTVMMISLPSGLTLYIMFSTFLGIAQQYIMNKQTSVKTI